MNTKNDRKAFIYWDNSNIYIAAQKVAIEKEGQGARYRVRIEFKNLYDLACAGREVGRAYAVGSVPPELRMLWNQLENAGVEVDLQQRGESSHSEQGVDAALQLRMLEDMDDNNGDPGIVVLLTGDGSGFAAGTGFHANLNRLYKKGWGIEVLSWRYSCSKAMRDWAQEVGVFIDLDDFYEQLTFLAPPQAGEKMADVRHAAPVDLTKRRVWH